MLARIQVYRRMHLFLVSGAAVLMVAMAALARLLQRLALRSTIATVANMPVGYGGELDGGGGAGRWCGGGTYWWARSGLL